jgi:hypothetical protein
MIFWPGGEGGDGRPTGSGALAATDSRCPFSGIAGGTCSAY